MIAALPTCSIHIDDALMATPEPWARKLRDQRNIGDFDFGRSRSNTTGALIGSCAT
jgi:hypothetical protein